MALTGLSPPTGYLYNPLERMTFKHKLLPRRHICINDYYSSLAQGHPSLSGALVLEHPNKEDETKLCCDVTNSS